MAYMKERDWIVASDRVGVAISSIVVGIKSGGIDAGRGVELITKYCQSCYNIGYQRGVRRGKDLAPGIRDGDM